MTITLEAACFSMHPLCDFFRVSETHGPETDAYKDALIRAFWSYLRAADNATAPREMDQPNDLDTWIKALETEETWDHDHDGWARRVLHAIGWLRMHNGGRDFYADEYPVALHIVAQSEMAQFYKSRRDGVNDLAYW